MSVVPKDVPRRVVPRWREFATAATTGELKPVAIRDPEAAAVGREEELARSVADWESAPSVGHATEVISTAFVLDLYEPARNAAEYVIRHQDEAGAAATSLAEVVLGHTVGTATRDEDDVARRKDDRREGKPAPSRPRTALLIGGQRVAFAPVGPVAAAAPVVPPALAARIGRLRARLRGDPRNALAWMDLGRLYACIGQRDQAERAIRAALALAPHHRFTLRSAARYYLHAHEPDRAHDVLRRNPAVPHDPWLVAAEIAVATAAKREPRQTKTARAMLASKQFSPFHTAELAGAVATLEANAGKNRVAKQLFQDALRDPTENAVAQAEWAARKLRLFDLPPQALQTPRSWEARAYAAYAGRRWQDALDATNQWVDDEPFSSRAVGLGTSIAAVGLGRFDEAIALAKRGLLASPHDDSLRLNLLYPLAEAGRLHEAMTEFEQIDATQLGPTDSVAYLADAGLLLYRLAATDPSRQDLLEKGREKYQQAAERAREFRLHGLDAVVDAYWAGEEVLAGAPESDVVRRASKPLPKNATTDLAIATERLERIRARAAAATNTVSPITVVLR